MKKEARMKKTVDIVSWLWHPEVDANILFNRLSCVFNNYHFVTSKSPKYYMYSLHNQVSNIPKEKTKIYYAIENVAPKMADCDWGFGFHLEEDVGCSRYFRLPNYVRLGAGRNLIKKNVSPEKILRSKKKFCAFIYSNGSVGVRNSFFKKLSRYKKVDAPGKVFNNMPFIGGFKNTDQLLNHLRTDFYKKFDLKVDFLEEYKFVISFENESSRGYTSEKLYHAMLANCIPIYWGNPNVNLDFNTKSFLNLHDYGSVDALIDRVVQLDNDDNLYMSTLKQPWYPNNMLTKYTNPKRILNRFQEVFE